MTATGQRTSIVPGEHLVQRMKPKVPVHGVVEALRFVGADPSGRDVLVPISPGETIESVLG